MASILRKRKDEAEKRKSNNVASGLATQTGSVAKPNGNTREFRRRTETSKESINRNLNKSAGLASKGINQTTDKNIGKAASFSSTGKSSNFRAAPTPGEQKTFEKRCT